MDPFALLVVHLLSEDIAPDDHTPLQAPEQETGLLFVAPAHAYTQKVLESVKETLSQQKARCWQLNEHKSGVCADGADQELLDHVLNNGGNLDDWLKVATLSWSEVMGKMGNMGNLRKGEEKERERLHA